MSQQLIPDSAVQAIKDSVVTELIDVDGVTYTTRPVFAPPATPQPAALELNTLAGIVDLLKSDLEEFDKGVAVHVQSHNCVRVISGLHGRFDLRNVYAEATAEEVLGTSFDFGRFVDAETFNVALQSLFVQTDELRGVLRVVGNIKEESVRTTGDDGVTQTVTAKSGIVRVEEVNVPNPVTLQPYRTFREVEQPASPFVLRLRQSSGGQMPSGALFEADGGKWKLDAIERIKAYLKEQLETITIIA